MITGYILLILVTMPPHVPDVKIQMPVADISECVAMAAKLGEVIHPKNPIATATSCMPIEDHPGPQGERVD